MRKPIRLTKDAYYDLGGPSNPDLFRRRTKSGWTYWRINHASNQSNSTLHHRRTQRTRSQSGAHGLSQQGRLLALGGGGDEAIDSLKAFAALFPINLDEWEIGGYSSRNGVRWSEKDRWGDGGPWGLSGLRLLRWLRNNVEPRLFKGKWYSGRLHYEDGKPVKWIQRYSKVQFESCCPLTGFCFDDDLIEPILKFIEGPPNRKLDVPPSARKISAEDRRWHLTSLKGILDASFAAWVQTVTDDIDYAASMEAFVEASIANDWTYRESGALEMI